MCISQTTIISSVSLALAALLVYLTHTQIRAVSTPLLNAFMKTMDTNMTTNNQFLDLHLENNGPGAAKQIEWFLCVKSKPLEYCEMTKGSPCHILSAESRKFRKELQSLGSKCHTNVKGLLYKGNDNEDEAYYRLFIRYKGAMSLFFKPPLLFEFTIAGEQINNKTVKKKNFESGKSCAEQFTNELNKTREDQIRDIKAKNP